MAEPIPKQRLDRDDAEARRQALSLAESIDAAAADLAINGPVSKDELARMLADLDAEWSATEGEPRQGSTFGPPSL